MSLTLSLSFKCNSRCKTCNIHTKHSKEADDLSNDEWKKVFKSLGRSPFWVTISGGEPFLRPDISETVCSLYDLCKPTVVNIPTNGLLFERIPKVVKEIAQHCRNSQIVINLSIDEIGEAHDEIRGVPGNYRKAMLCYGAVKKIDLPNLSLGIHTVISRFNVTRIPEIYKKLRSYKPDSYITEIAEERVELDTIGAGITPEYEDYENSVDFLIHKLKEDNFSRVGKITRAFRIEYYKMVKQILREHRQVIPCYSGFASAQIAPNGDVWVCCVKAKSIGNLRDVDYDFRKVWFSEKAAVQRRAVKNAECYCPLANASYTNMLHNFKTLSKVTWNLITTK